MKGINALLELLQANEEIEKALGLLNEIYDKEDEDDDILKRLHRNEKFMKRAEVLAILMNHSATIADHDAPDEIKMPLLEKMARFMADVTADIYVVGYRDGKREAILNSMVVADEE